MSQKIVPDSITKWLHDLDLDGDVLVLRNAYIDLCGGDHVTALILSQLLYWHLPDKKGTGSKLRVQKEGHLWVARTHKDWMQECRITEEVAKSRISWLKEHGLVKTKCFMFNGFRTLHLRIDFDCLAARVDALNRSRPVGAKTVDRSPTMNADRSGENTPTGQTPAPRPITESTPATTAEKSRTTPKSSPGEDFSDDLRDNGRKNYLSLAREDPASELMLSLFPGDPNSPLVSPEVARKFVKRRESILGGNAALLLAKMFSYARYEGLEVPEWRRCRTFSELFEAKNLAPALAACREAATEKLKEIKSIKDTATDNSVAIQMMRILDDEITGETDLVRFCLGRTDIPVCCSLAHRKQHSQLGEVHRTYANEIKKCLSRELYWSREDGREFAEVFGVDEDEIKQARAEWVAALEAEENEMERLLR